MNRKSKIIVSVVGIAIVTLALLGITYAYYLTRIQGNTNTNSIVATTADLKLKYDDGNGLVTAQDIMPGTTITKTFAVSNEGKSVVEGYLVVLEDVINGLSRKQDLTYTLTCINDDNESCGKVEKVIFPNESDITLLYSNTIAVDEVHNYTLTITYENLTDTDQSTDMGKSFSGRVNIVDQKSINNVGAVNFSGTLANNIISKASETSNVNVREYDTTTNVTIEGPVVNSHSVMTGDTEIYFGTDYVYDEEEHAFYLSGNIISANFDECESGSKDCGKYTLYKDYDAKSNKLHEIVSLDYRYDEESSDSYIDIEEKITSIKFTSVTLPDSMASTSPHNLYKTEDDLGVTYYFSGNPTNNYVSFGKESDFYNYLACGTTEEYNEQTGEYEIKTDCSNYFKTEYECEDYAMSYYMGYECKAIEPYQPSFKWRIVRINGDGTIRLINYENIDYYLFNSSRNIIETWYTVNLENNYSKYIADGIFCSAEEFSHMEYDWEKISVYKPVEKLMCGETTKYRVINKNINKPIGLLNMSESIYAGNYLQEDFCTMSISAIYENDGTYIYNNKRIVHEAEDCGIRPVINLKADVSFTGSGTIDDPYVIQTS